MNLFSRYRGFTLAEIAVVLVIVALLLGGLLAPLASQNDARMRSDNAKALADIREALIGFAVVNGRLPCPADRTQATGTGGATCPGAAGCEAITGTSCTSATGVGVLPWATLGLPETDAWNARFTYRVTPLFARTLPQAGGFGCAITPAPANAAFALCSPGDISIRNSAGTALATRIPAIVVSHGRNGLGAWLPNGTQTPGAAGDESENANDDAVFISDPGIDDQLVWIPPNILMNRMIAAGKLP